MGREIGECFFNINISLFKGLQYFVHEAQVHQLISRMESRQVLHRRGDSAGSGKYPFEEENFLLFLKDDVRPFVLYLLHTRSFKVFLWLLSLLL